MVSLADAKRHLGVAGEDEDGLIARLITSANAYLERIGVDVEAAPVGEAVLLLVGVLHSRVGRDFNMRHEAVEDISSRTFFDPNLIDEANWKVIHALVAPYREVGL